MLTKDALEKTEMVVLASVRDKREVKVRLNSRKDTNREPVEELKIMTGRTQSTIHHAVPNKERLIALPVTTWTGPRTQKNAVKVTTRESSLPASECSGSMDTTQKHA